MEPLSNRTNTKNAYNNNNNSSIGNNTSSSSSSTRGNANEEFPVPAVSVLDVSETNQKGLINSNLKNDISEVFTELLNSSKEDEMNLSNNENHQRNPAGQRITEIREGDDSPGVGELQMQQLPTVPARSDIEDRQRLPRASAAELKNIKIGLKRERYKTRIYIKQRIYK